MEKAVGIILDGKALSEKIRGEIAQEVNDYLSKGSYAYLLTCLFFV